MTQETEAPSISGWQLETSTGSEVWVGYYKERDAICFLFTNKEGEKTYLALGVEATRAMVRLCEKALPTAKSQALEILVKFAGEAAQKLNLMRDDAVWKVVEPAQGKSGDPRG